MGCWMSRVEYATYNAADCSVVLQIPDWLIGESESIRKEVETLCQGEPFNEDLLYQINWEVQQWVLKMCDDHGLEER